MAKILLVTNSPGQRGLAHYYYLALRDLVQEKNVKALFAKDADYNTNRPFTRRLINKVESRFFNNYSKWQTNRIVDIVDKNEMTHVVLFNSAGLEPDDIIKLSKLPKIKLYQYLSDSPSGMSSEKFKNSIPTLKYFEAVFVYAKSLIPVIYQYGASKVFHLPFGYCKYTHLKAQPNSKTQHQGIYYFGTWGPLIEDWLSPLATFGLKIEGNSWDRSKFAYLKSAAQKGGIVEGGMSEKAAQAAIVVNFIRAQHGCFNSMKTFELAAAGACVITNRTEEQIDYFEDMKEIVYFDSQQDMLLKVEHLLNNEALQAAIRTNAYNKVQKHSYHERATMLIALID
ncbi:MAG: hypothetical protein CMB80_27850 [Flammeovirgaceae bacterium]|nr:hypothetical protein [Flammeovirgaceae bacterium]|tara:strand:+ start:3444 stop:4463 length:1020 start_codon:yes stop_codon:yes gene_type:complete